jgi:Zn-dependent peptidase ImmA (M78 family)
LIFRRGFKAEANRIAVRIRGRMGLSAIDPIDPEVICERFDVQVIPLSELYEQPPFCGTDKGLFSAVTVPYGHQVAIVHNDSHHPYRQRSNICHELAHCFLGHQFTPPLTSEGERDHTAGIEAEANYLAGTLLIPNEAAIHIVRHGLFSVAQAAYGVSRPMLNFRLRVSGAHTIHRRKLSVRAA